MYLGTDILPMDTFNVYVIKRIIYLTLLKKKNRKIICLVDIIKLSSTKPSSVHLFSTPDIPSLSHGY